MNQEIQQVRLAQELLHGRLQGRSRRLVTCNFPETAGFRSLLSSLPLCRLPYVAMAVRRIPLKIGIPSQKSTLIIDHRFLFSTFSKATLAFAWSRGRLRHFESHMPSPSPWVPKMLSGLRATVWFPRTRGHYSNAPPSRRYTSRPSLASTAPVRPAIERSPFSSGFVGKESFPTFSHINSARNSVYHGICSSMHRLYKAYLQHQDFSRPPFCFPSSSLIFFPGSWSKWSCWAASYSFQSPQLLLLLLSIT